MAATTGLGQFSMAAMASSRLGTLGGPAELGDVGAGDERAAVTDQHDGLDVGVGGGLGNAIADALAHVVAEGVDWRVVDDDQSDVAVGLETNRLGECGHGRE